MPYISKERQKPVVEKTIRHDRRWEYENSFYRTCDITRIGKIIAQWELFKMVDCIPGAILECGVFRGNSLIRFASFRQLMGDSFNKRIIGFDTFGRYPNTNYEADKPLREQFVQEAGEQSISQNQLMKILERKGCEKNVELIAGDICKTVPEYIKRNPHLKISLLNLDVDIYEPSVTVIEYLFPCIPKGGILILDNYGTFPGESKAIDEYLAKKNIRGVIRKLPFCMTPCYIIVD